VGRLSSSQPGGAPPVAPVTRPRGAVLPDRLYVNAPGLTVETARRISEIASAPKLSGAGARSIHSYYGEGFFGLAWDRSYMWNQEAGAKPFTMRRLAGKTIPMWIDDPTGKVARENPKADKRVTASGRRQVKIFRKAAKIGARKTVVSRDSAGRLIHRDVPASFPGAPGRISHREIVEYPHTTGRIAKMVSRSHVGVRWRHPGLVGRNFMHEALVQTSVQVGLGTPVVNVAFRSQ
jgi:hypothetical protein